MQCTLYGKGKKELSLHHLSSPVVNVASLIAGI